MSQKSRISQVSQVFGTIQKANNPLTSAEIKDITGLTAKQVHQATSSLKRAGRIFPERRIDLIKKAYNRYRDKPQRWAIDKDIFYGNDN